MERPHPLLDRIEATNSPPPLKSLCLTILRTAWPAVGDVGDAHYSLLEDLLPLSTAPQLAVLEYRSPHLVQHTNHIWRALAISEFIDVRKAVEDGRLRPEDEPRSWREQYEREEVRREAKMEELLSRMRGQLKDYKEGRKTIERVDGLQLAKRRKTQAPARPRTLMEKARSNTKAITSVYAPRRRKPAAPAPVARAAAPPAPTPPSAASLAGSPPPSRRGSAATSPGPAPPLARPLKRPLPTSASSASPATVPTATPSFPPPTKRTAISSPPASSRSTSTTPNQGFSPPPAAAVPPPIAAQARGQNATSPPSARPVVTTVTRVVTVRRPPRPNKGTATARSPPLSPPLAQPRTGAGSGTRADGSGRSPPPPPSAPPSAPAPPPLRPPPSRATGTTTTGGTGSGPFSAKRGAAAAAAAAGAAGGLFMPRRPRG